MAGSIGPSSPGGGSSSSDATVEGLNAAIHTEGHTGTTDSSQPNERDWAGSLDSSQETDESPGNTFVPGHVSIGVGPGPSGSGGPSGTDYNPEGQIQGHG